MNEDHQNENQGVVAAFEEANKLATEIRTLLEPLRTKYPTAYFAVVGELYVQSASGRVPFAVGIPDLPVPTYGRMLCEAAGKALAETEQRMMAQAARKTMGSYEREQSAILGPNGKPS